MCGAPNTDAWDPGHAQGYYIFAFVRHTDDMKYFIWYGQQEPRRYKLETNDYFSKICRDGIIAGTPEEIVSRTCVMGWYPYYVCNIHILPNLINVRQLGIYRMEQCSGYILNGLIWEKKTMSMCKHLFLYVRHKDDINCFNWVI